MALSTVAMEYVFNHGNTHIRIKINTVVFLTLFLYFVFPRSWWEWPLYARSQIFGALCPLIEQVNGIGDSVWERIFGRIR